MNRTSIGLSVFAACSAFALVFAYRKYGPGLMESLFDDIYYSCKDEEEEEEDDGSSLEQDFEDILKILPLEKIRLVVEDFAQHDKQIADTIAFVNEQQRFILKELSAIPQVQFYTFVAKELNLDVDRWLDDFGAFWKSMPKTRGDKSARERGGLTNMIRQVMRLIPRDELHELLCKKSRQSKSFRSLLVALKIRQMYELVEAIQKSAGLQRHYHWAIEAGLEVIFAVELLGELYVYLTQKVS
ncbi:uncharacterized protein LOC106636252 [Copidosoma floridanum]|uniref:uncharacterized protein LOC106636252 n=1 Tax=Copidosoma floridanum TaxID=29053 RepID=UPI0006C96CC5|nr:uncharacterized protein LOC106636252 [Copidosoma floridanum]